MKKLLGLLILIAIAAIGYNFYLNNYQKYQNAGASTIQIGDTRYQIEIADTGNLHAKGLSERDAMPLENGMLFLFNEKHTPSFWMRGMRFALDFVWIDGDTIVDLTENVPAPLTETYAPTFSPKAPIDKVLEINAGEIQKNKFMIGQKVIITLIRPQTTK